MQRTLIRSGFAALSALFVSLGARESSAQSFYDRGKISVALERGFGVHYTSQNEDPEGPGNDRDRDGASIGVLWYGALTPYHWTRAAIDGFIMDRLSLGGSIAFYTQVGDFDDDGFLFAPRVGYALPLSQMFTFWPRGGVTFWDQGNRSVFGISLEGMFVFSPNPNWGVLFGPTLDWGFIGGAGNDVDYSEFSLGIPSVGLLATF